MKKVLALLIGMMMILSLSGFTNYNPASVDQEAEKVYEEAIKKTAEMENQQAAMVIKMSISDGKETVDIAMKMDAKLQRIGEKLEMSMNGTLTAMDQTISMGYYYKDGYYYVNAADQKVKMPLDLSELVELSQGYMNNTTPVAFMESLTMKKSGSDKILSYKISKNQMKKLFDKSIGSMGELGTAVLGDAITFHSMTGSSIIDKAGNITSETLKMRFSAKSGKENIICNLTIACTYQQPDANFKITFPSNLNSYPLMTLPTDKKAA